MKKILAYVLIAAYCFGLASNCKADDLQLNSKSAVLIDAENGRILYEKNARQKMPMASTTKIMTCIIALEYGNLNDEVKVSPYAASQPKVKMGITTQDTYILKDLLHAMMLESFNDVAVAIAEHISGSVAEFAKLMNAKAKEIGANDTNFVTPNGLDADGHYSTAYDMALIGAYAIKNAEFLEITNTKSYSLTSSNTGRAHTANNRDAFLSQMEGAIGIKTGFTGKAGYCFVGAVSKDDKKIVSCILACGWPPNKSYKWKDTSSLMKYGLDNFSRQQIIQPQSEYKNIIIKNGVKKDAETYIDANIEMLISKNDMVKMETIINNNEAPIEENQILGYEKVIVNGEVVSQIKIKSKEKVKKFDYVYCISKVLKQLFI